MPQKIIKKYLLSVSAGTGIGIISSSVLVFMMAAALTIGNIPAMLISPATVILLAFGSFCGGFASARFSGERGILFGAVSGVLFFVVAWISGAVFDVFGSGTAAIIKAVMIITASSFGGIIGVNYIKRK